MRTRRSARAQVAAALVLTVLLGLPDLLLAPPPAPARQDARFASATSTPPDTTADTAVTFRGPAFDICRAPSLAAMRAWRKSSPYGAVGIPYAGRGRECAGQPHLTRSWVAEVHRMGWRVLPVFTGAQPSCARASETGASETGASETGRSETTASETTPSETSASGTGTDTPHDTGKSREDRDGARAAGEAAEEAAEEARQAPDARRPRHLIGAVPAVQGEREGNEAVRRAAALGMGPGSALYISLKSYDLGDSPCVRATLDFIRAWNREVRRQGYVPGLHSDADAGVRHMERARRAGAGDLPSALWFARWNRRPSLYGERALHPYAWRVKRRIHQYEGRVSEEYGGHRLTIGRNMTDAPVARIRD
ncbi:DUF1906 domain-containing protein [Streptomyces sp. NPDC001985]|uniref:DUF1906 domain-containing protein n=1 Tax=Streptomyces sp. NPDC001985 TaxID=3154406 RepID=UPI0033234CA6